MRSVSGGVQSLRSLFEQGNNDTSPPSRGRSPAGSVTSDNFRPISKVRTSFISVERSGQQGSPFAARKMSTGEGSVGGGNAKEGAPMLNPFDGGNSKMNGSAVPTDSKDETTNSGQERLGENGAQKPSRNSSSQKEAASVAVSPADPDKPTTRAENEPGNMLPADPKDESAVSGGAALKDNEEGLGSVLKGSPFQESSDQSVAAAEPSKGSTFDKLSSPSKAKLREPSKVNGQPKTPGSANKEAAANSMAKTAASRLSAVDTKQGPSAASKAPVPKSADKASKSPRTPQTEKHTDATAKQPSKTSSPRQTIPSKARNSNPAKEVEKPPAPSTRQSSLASKPSTVAASRPRQASSNANTAPNRRVNPPPAAPKPRAKSPTRPVRLPASATAPTQASAAKHEEPPLRSPSRASLASISKPHPPTLNKIRPSGSSTAGASSRSKPPRSSLPPQSNANQKPKPRTSTSSTKADGGSFLARMMRPTESSAKKAHEKIEVKSPPRNSGPPKRKSDGHKEPKGSPQAKGGSEESDNPQQSNGIVAESEAPKPSTAAEGGPSESAPTTSEVDLNNMDVKANGAPKEPVQAAQ